MKLNYSLLELHLVLPKGSWNSKNLSKNTPAEKHLKLKTSQLPLLSVCLYRGIEVLTMQGLNSQGLYMSRIPCFVLFCFCRTYIYTTFVKTAKYNPSSLQYGSHLCSFWTSFLSVILIKIETATSL